MNKKKEILLKAQSLLNQIDEPTEISINLIRKTLETLREDEDIYIPSTQSSSDLNYQMHMTRIAIENMLKN